jgi:hypothetical protein
VPQQEYVLRVGKEAEAAVASWLCLSSAPEWVRLSTIAPLSNWGYPPGAEGAVLRVADAGLVMGVDGREDVPRDFVPWTNIAYLTDGTQLVREQAAKAQKQAGLQSAAANAELAPVKPKK